MHFQRRRHCYCRKIFFFHLWLKDYEARSGKQSVPKHRTAYLCPLGGKPCLLFELHKRHDHGRSVETIEVVICLLEILNTREDTGEQWLSSETAECNYFWK